MISWVSPSVTRVLGWQVHAVVGRSMTQFVHPDDVPEVARAQRELLAQGTLFGRMELRMATADGRWRWMSVLRHALLDEQNRLIGGVDAMRDIQAEKDAQSALAESEERFRRSMMDAAIGMAIVAPDGGFLRVNPALCDLLGRDEQALMRSTWQELTHPDDLPADEALVHEVLSGKRDTYRMAKRYLRPDGQIVWADLTVSCVRDAEGVARYLMSQIVDITHSVEAREALASSEEHYRLLAENSSDVVFRASPGGRLLWISPSLTEVLGWKPQQALGRRMLEFLRADDVPEGLVLDADNHARVDFEGRCRTAAGPYLWMDISSRPLIDEGGTLIGRVGRLRDVQTQHEAQEALRRSEQRFRTAMESAPTGMAVVGLNREFLEVNTALCQLLGRSEAWLLSHSMQDVLDPLDDDVDRRLRAQLLSGLIPSLTRDHQMIRSDGERVLVEQSIGLLRDDEGRATAYVSQFNDVTEARQARDQLRFLATHDSLTELLNRRELVTRISGVLGRTPRTGINVGVLFIDLDGLKPVNDTYGHVVGDEVIVTVARRIREQVRANDVLARFGGDEFVLVLPAVHTVNDVERIAAGLHDVVERPMSIEGYEITMTLSIGVAVVHPGQDPDVALKQADAALYRAKREGKARTAVFDAQRDGN
jgi:diguanylate cyclase (GGDEF)-like protein/PAS domain S-box-containing protein